MSPYIPTWYVTFRQPGDAPGGYVRSTEAFLAEIEAKRFAEKKLAEGCDVSAGTINPHHPKRTIGPLQIEDWLNIEK